MDGHLGIAAAATHHGVLSSERWDRALTAAIVVLVAIVVARLADRAMARRDLDAASATRYRVLRRSIISSIIAVGVLSALLVIPAVRAVAGGILASGAVIGIIAGFAAQSALSNFVAGLMIAFAQPLRLGDSLLTSDGPGTVEEIGLVYTLIRLEDGSRLVVPNSKLTSDTIRNASIGTNRRVAEITVQLPLSTDLEQALSRLRAALPGERKPDVYVSALTDKATITVRAHADGPESAEELARDLRLWTHGALRASGALA